MPHKPPTTQSSMTKPTVFVSGATGYIAQHIVKQLLDSQKYNVIGSYRNSEKADQLRANFKNNSRLSLVKVEDLGHIDAFAKVFQEYGPRLDYIMHTASPLDFTAKDLENDTIVPAINGTKGIIQATVNYAPNVKKFIMTSSVAARSCTKIVYTEKSWNDRKLEDSLTNPHAAYSYSKTAAEKLAWELHKELHPKFSLTTINPVQVLGPQCFDANAAGKLNSSSGIINDLLHSKPNDEKLNKRNGSYIDVRDVARAHLECIANDKLDGHRLILSEAKYTMQTLADIAEQKFPTIKRIKLPKAYQVQTKKLSKNCQQWWTIMLPKNYLALNSRRLMK
ncbi:hypothetical protein ACO0QE_000112 [Hanseniaspora vineae]